MLGKGLTAILRAVGETLLLRLLLFLAVTAAILAALLYTFQGRLIYLPQRYAVDLGTLPASVEVVPFNTAAGSQKAFYLVPPSGKRARLWVTFGGNAMTALDWLEWAGRHPDPNAAFLLIDYPGYGASEGQPSRRTINAASVAAFDALAARLASDPTVLATSTSLLGHSLGAAAALDLAVLRPPHGIVLTAPFTGIRELGSRLFGPWVAPLVRENFDNVARLAELTALPATATPTNPARPVVVIVHGRADEIIPFELGVRLAAGSPGVQFVAVDGHHNDLYQVAARQVREAMVTAAAPD